MSAVSSLVSSFAIDPGAPCVPGPRSTGLRITAAAFFLASVGTLACPSPAVAAAVSASVSKTEVPVPVSNSAEGGETQREQSGLRLPVLPTPVEIESLTDQELTDLSVHWAALAAPQRRALLKTVQRRMHRRRAAVGQRQDRKVQGRLPLQRRFGRVVRQQDGRVVSIETRVVQRADGSRSTITQRMTFGAGFERRQRLAEQPSVTAAATSGQPVAGANSAVTPPQGLLPDVAGSASNANLGAITETVSIGVRDADVQAAEKLPRAIIRGAPFIRLAEPSQPLPMPPGTPGTPGTRATEATP